MSDQQPKEAQFFYKKDFDSSKLPKGAVWITEDIFCVPEESRFGPIVPNVEFFFQFLKIPFFVEGFVNYNSLGFTTQVPARINYLIPIDLTFKFSYWKKINLLKKADPELFKQFSQIEYSLYDCLINFENLGDGYFNSMEAQAKYTVKLCKELKKTYQKDLDLDKLFTKAVAVNPKLNDYFPYKLNFVA